MSFCTRRGDYLSPDCIVKYHGLDVNPLDSATSERNLGLMIVYGRLDAWTPLTLGNFSREGVL